MFIDVSVDNGKYKVQMPESGKLVALRYDEEWRDLLGDNLVYHLALELQENKEKIEKCLSAVKFAEEISADQTNGITDGQICISALKDIRRHLNGN